MFTLVAERGKYLRVREGVTQEEVTARFSFPAEGVFQGAIIALPPPRRFCYALAGDSYKTVAKREGADEEEIKRINRGAAIYPTMRIWLP